jgi:hypothetical protein
MESNRNKRRNSTGDDSSTTSGGRVHHYSTNSLSGVGGIQWLNEPIDPPPEHPPAEDNRVNNDNNNDDESYYEDAGSGSVFTDLINDEDQQQENNINNIEININNNDNDNNNNNRNRTEVTVATCRDNIISENTLKCYVCDTIHLCRWINTTHPEWYTPYGRIAITDIYNRRPDEKPGVHRLRMTTSVTELIRNAGTNPWLHMHLMTASEYMSYLVKVRKKDADGNFLSNSSYGNKRSALYHLFRVHNQTGYSEVFRRELANLDNMAGAREGKEPMSVELYKSLCRWLLDYGTRDGIFAYSYLILTWNLACRAGNTARITYQDMTWTESFDSFSIYFSHSKTDQLGEEAKYPRHVYSNPLVPLICPILSLSVYFTSCFNTSQQPNEKIFPGNGQASRFSTILNKVIQENGGEVYRMGYEPGVLGTHSIRKGAVSYLASLPGGPPAALSSPSHKCCAVMVSCGWWWVSIFFMFFLRCIGSCVC